MAFKPVDGGGGGRPSSYNNPRVAPQVQRRIYENKQWSSASGSTIRQGSRGSSVKELQRRLGISADGIFGPNTRQAVINFQRANGLAADGIVGPKTWAALKNMSSKKRTPSSSPKKSASSSASSSSGLLRYGSRGSSVKELQRLLGIKADGIFGPDTQRAVRNFQKKYGLAVDGIVGPKTWARLRNRSSGSKGSSSPKPSGGGGSSSSGGSKAKAPATPSKPNLPSFKPTKEQQEAAKKLQEIMSQLEKKIKTPFSYDPSKDSRYTAAQQLANAQAELQSRGAMEEMNDRGILNSTVTSDRLGQIRQGAADTVAAMIPELQQNAYQRYQNEISNLADYANQLLQERARQDALALSQFEALAPYQYLTEYQRQTLPLNWTEVIGEVPKTVPGQSKSSKKSSSKSSSRPTLRSGSRGNAVKDLQKKLKAAGFNPGSIDGVFGSKTRAAVRAYQRSKGLAADGIVGPKTWAKLG